MYESDTESDDNNPYLAYLKQKFPFDEEAAARKNNELIAKIEADLKKWAENLAIGIKKWAGVIPIWAMFKQRKFR